MYTGKASRTTGYHGHVIIFYKNIKAHYIDSLASIKEISEYIVSKKSFLFDQKSYLSGIKLHLNASDQLTHNTNYFVRFNKRGLTNQSCV